MARIRHKQTTAPASSIRRACSPGLTCNLLSLQALDRIHSVLTGNAAPDGNASVDGDGSAKTPFIIDALPFVDSGDATTIYSFAPTAALRLRALVFGGATIAVNNGAPSAIVQQELESDTYNLTVTGGTFDLVLMSCDAADPVCQLDAP